MAILTNDTIILDDGHGLYTPGKRSPIFPSDSGLKSETGNFMHENEFNRAVVKYLGEHLLRNKFKVINVAPTDEDTPLSTRVAIANKAKAGLYISVHANAMTSNWGKAKGVETFAYTDSAKSKLIGSIIHKHVKGGTPQVDRGLKNGDWLYIVRKTDMPTILVECGFMDNLEEVKLLLSDEYRRETAKEIALAVCEIYERTFIDESKPVVISKPKTKSELSLAVEWAKENKISDGSDLKGTVSRVQLLVMLYRNYKGVANMTWAQEKKLAVEWAKENKISDGSNLADNCSRAELIVMLKRAEDKFGGKK